MRNSGTGGRWRIQPGERLALLMAGDFLAASLAAVLALALWARLEPALGFSLTFLRFRAPWFTALPVLWLVLMANLYNLQRASSRADTVRGVLIAAGGGLAVYLIVYFNAEGDLPRRGMLYFLILAALLTFAWRMVYLAIFTAPAFLRRGVIVGAGVSGRGMAEVLAGMRSPPFHVVGLIDDDPRKAGSQVGGARVLGDNTRLAEVVAAEGVTEAVVAITGPMGGAMFQALLDAQEKGVRIVRMPVLYERLLGRVPIRYLESDWLLRSFVDEIQVNGLYLLVKRMMDIGAGLAGLSILALLYPWIALAILLESGRPILFRQERIGNGGEVFRVTKFRTMRPDAEAPGQAQWAQSGDPRATRVGVLLRKLHVDEFPQFWNVLKGEMGLIGPRPERPEFVHHLEQQIPFYRARLLVKPGLTGWAQVHQVYASSVEDSAEKLEYDLYYIKHRGLVLDALIILRTIGMILGLRGV
jgi:exopolysaccharide biosynthesis polyprenyl glycosylphosphotransferase